MYPFVVKAEYYDFDSDEQKTIFCLLYGHDITEIASRMKDYCDPEDIEIHCVGDEAQLFEVSEDIATSLRLGCGNYASGQEILQENKENAVV